MPDMAQARHQRTVLLALDGGHASDFAFQTYMTTIRRDGDQAVLFTCKQLGNILQSFWKTAVLTYDKEALAGRLHMDEGETKALLKPYGDKLASAGVRFKPSIAMSDNPGHCIVSTAQEENAHLIVMGSRGRGLLRRTLLGSCSDYVTMHSDIPVVLCPRGEVDNTKSSDCRKNMSRN